MKTMAPLRSKKMQHQVGTILSNDCISCIVCSHCIVCNGYIDVNGCPGFF